MAPLACSRQRCSVLTETLVSPAPAAVISNGVPVAAIWPRNRIATRLASPSASAMS